MPDKAPSDGDRALSEVRLQEAGAHRVNVPITCVITRFGLQGARHLLRSYADYRRVVQEATTTQTPGLLQSAFLVESPRVFYNLSLWADEAAIPHFGTNVPAHVHAGNRIIGKVAFAEGRGPEIWSTKWRLVSVSSNLNWGDFDLRSVIVDHGRVVD
jgi:hypothetical protein